MIPTPGLAVLIVAAGRGLRAGGDVPKTYRLLRGMPVLRRTVRAFLPVVAPDAIHVVIHVDDRALYEDAIAGLGLPPPITGGTTRQESVRAGLEALAAKGGCRQVLIHDAARCFINQATLAHVIQALNEAPAVVPALAVVDSLRRSYNGVMSDVVDRDGLWRVQTPQGFHFAPILAAHRAAAPGATDDAEIARSAGVTVALVPGSEGNIKLTTNEDFMRAESLLAATMTSRTGMGFDVHAFEDGDHVWLCGLKIPHNRRLKGHSDADVALHALTDAILGAIADGDIGQHFPPSDPAWRGAASDQFLRHAADRVAARGGIIDHVDLTIIAEAPKIGPHRDAMRARVAAILKLHVDRISIKATTTEGLGFTGRREGIGAQAVATVRLPSPEE